MQSVAVIESHVANTDSICRAVIECGGSPSVVSTPEKIIEADKIILPGVGAFGAAMDSLEKEGLVEAIKEVASIGTPTLGICLGMQLLASESEETGSRVGLQLIPGVVKRLLPKEFRERVPHVGWNSINLTKQNPLMKGIKDGTDFYFVHGYYFDTDIKYVIATSPYCGTFASVIGNENIFGTQFHPEKSLKNGLSLLKNFLMF